MRCVVATQGIMSRYQVGCISHIFSRVWKQPLQKIKCLVECSSLQQIHSVKCCPTFEPYPDGYTYSCSRTSVQPARSEDCCKTSFYLFIPLGWSKILNSCQEDSSSSLPAVFVSQSEILPNTFTDESREPRRRSG